jgi:hypothetical protein
MTVIEHGDWQLYTPAPLPEGAPPNALFSRRISDGVDWYDYVNNSANFQTDTIKMTVNSTLVCAAVTDPVTLFPGNGSILEVTDVPLDDPQGDWGRRTYDASTQTFSDEPALPPDPSAEMKIVLDRIAALEAKLGG